MQSSYSKIFKGDSINKHGKKGIFTEVIIKNKEEIKDKPEKNQLVENYDNLGKTIIEDARRKRDRIISEAYEKAADIAKKSQEKGYEEGYKKGYKKGVEEGSTKAYEDGYKKNYDRAKKEEQDMLKKADDVLKSAISEKERYLEEKEGQIKQLIVNAVESILRHEVKDKESLNDIVFDSLKQMKGTNTFVIKGRKKYCSEFKEKVDMWKQQIPFKGDIFIIPDESIEEGNVVIERNNGKMVFSIDTACERIREIFKDEG
jgi:flagellar assembly protein FliH